MTKDTDVNVQMKKIPSREPLHQHVSDETFERRQLYARLIGR